jgi:hypothetical protein
VTINGQIFSIPDTFNLAEDVCHMEVGHNHHTVQLINRKPNGTLRIRFMGTAVNVKVMTAEADRFLKLMPEKPKVSLNTRLGLPKWVLLCLGVIFSPFHSR